MMKIVSIKQIYLILVINLLLGINLYACDETVIIDSVEYEVTGRWCDKALDSSLIAQPELLVKLPDSLTFEDYNIYVRAVTRDAFIEMSNAARKDSIILITDSGYRSGNFQRRIIKRRMAEGDSFEDIIRFVAPPGYSEHESGYALDLVPSEARFAHTKIYKWLKENANEFGFFETIPEDSTGKIYWESWHWVYKSSE